MRIMDIKSGCKRRKWMTGVILLALILGLAGCAGGGERASSSGSETAVSSEAASSGPETSGSEDASSGPETSGSEDAAAPAVEAPKLAFTTQDLDGNEVRSEELFAENELTMVNLWGTYCGPCINEMPGLEELNRRLEEKDCGIVGIVVDIPGIENGDMVSLAKEIIEVTGVTYQNLIPWMGYRIALPAEFIPTTYFVDSEGHIVGEAVVGARGADDYEAVIDELLDKST